MSQGGYKATGAYEDGCTKGTDLSIGNTLRHALVGVLRSRSPPSLPWRDRLVEGLQAIGAADAAESSLKYIQRQTSLNIPVIAGSLRFSIDLNSC